MLLWNWRVHTHISNLGAFKSDNDFKQACFSTFFAKLYVSGIHSYKFLGSKEIPIGEIFEKDRNASKFLYYMIRNNGNVSDKYF